MVILGGLELVAAGYLINEHQKHKKARQREEAEEARLRAERRRKRKEHEAQQQAQGSVYPADGRPGRPHKKYDYIPPPSALKPSAAAPNLAVPQGPPGRASSQPPPGYPGSPIMPGGYPAQQPPIQSQGPPPQGYGFPGYGPPPPLQQQGPPTQGLAAEYYNQKPHSAPPNVPPTGPYPSAPSSSSDPRRRSDPTLPGVNQPYYQTGYPEGVAELSADGPWMHDGHRTDHQRPHVRFNFAEGVPQPGDETPPPAYRP